MISFHSDENSGCEEVVFICSREKKKRTHKSVLDYVTYCVFLFFFLQCGR